jgi:hypothetical protein
VWLALNLLEGSRARLRQAHEPNIMPDFHETLARVARESPRIELGTVQICMLVAMRLLTEDEVLPELDEERLSDLYVRVVEVIDGGSRLPRHALMAQGSCGAVPSP